MKQKEKRNKTIDSRQRSDTKGQAGNYRNTVVELARRTHMPPRLYEQFL
jgi:hypothetical protein